MRSSGGRLSRWRSLAAALALCFGGQARAQFVESTTTTAPVTSASSTPAAALVSVLTIHGERIAADVTALVEGGLVLAIDPPRTVPLDELDVIEFTRNVVVSLEWLGQDNHDRAKPAREEGASGIQDIHLRVRGLPAGRVIKQLVVSGAPANREVWALDSGSVNSWRLILVQAAGADAADLFLEPTQADTFGLDFVLNVTFADGGEGNVSFKSSTHTGNTLAVVPPAADAATAAQPSGDTQAADAVALHGDHDSVLHASLGAWEAGNLTIRTTWAAESAIEIGRLRGVRFAAAPTEDASRQFTARLAAPLEQDAALVLGGDDSIAEVVGTAEGVAGGKLRFQHEGKTRSINLSRLVGVVFAGRESVTPDASAYQTVELANGDRLAGQLTGISAETLELASHWGGSLSPPRGLVNRIATRNGKLVYLSDLEPVSVEETSWFGRTLAWRRDQGLLGGPLAIRGRTFAKGLAVHARSSLTFDLAGGFKSFKAQLGFDDSSAGRGRVKCRVLGDGRELFAEADLRAGGDPRPLDFSVEGVKLLTLEVDFGLEEDIGDRINWADVRLFR